MSSINLQIKDIIKDIKFLILLLIKCWGFFFRQQEVSEEERQRQERLAKDRIEAARRRRREGQGSPEEAINHDSTDRMELQESLNMAIDRRHQHERDLLIQVGLWIAEVRVHIHHKDSLIHTH